MLKTTGATCDDETNNEPVLSEEGIFDKAALLDRLMGDENLLRVITEEFLEDALRQITVLKEALVDSDTKRVHRQAHTLKGASGNIGATTLQSLAFRIEDAGKAGDLVKAESLIPKLDEQFRIFKQRLAQ